MANRITNRFVMDLSEADAAKELNRLAKEIAEHDQHYYQDDAPTVSDEEYDSLKSRNSDIEARFPHLIRDNTPSKSVGAAQLLVL